LNPWRIFILKLFGAKLSGLPFVHSSAKIQIPWNLRMKHRACLGDRVNAYTLGRIEISECATVAQEAYLCTGSHDFTDPALQLIVDEITIEPHAFIGVRAMIMPGVRIGKNAVVGAMSVVTKDVSPDQVVAGNPARKIGERSLT
jgi:putative colanic acid biosynthesis acetyltransferase WcaF